VLDLDRPRDLESVHLDSADPVICVAPIVKLASALKSASRFNPARIVATSSASALTKRDSKWPLDRALSAHLHEAESAIVDRFGSHASILRPTMIYGSGRDRNVARLAGLIRRWRVVPLLGHRAGLRAPIHIDDLANVAVFVASTNQCSGRIVHVPGGEVLDYREMVHRIAQVCDASVWTPQVPVPAALVLGLAKFLPVGLAKLAAAAQRMEEDLVVPDDVVELGITRRGFRPDMRCLGSGNLRREHA
jgi:nucleoside-diphosphate-sugar epimerase